MKKLLTALILAMAAMFNLVAEEAAPAPAAEAKTEAKAKPKKAKKAKKQIVNLINTGRI